MADTKIDTGGGTVVGNDVTAGDFVGRDRISTQVFVDNLEKFARWIAIALVLAVALWGGITMVNTFRTQTETRQIEARKPFLDRQLTLYTEATKVAAIIATSDDPAQLATSRQRFLELYWGELSLVENRGVETAMVNFRNCLISKDACSKDDLQRASLNLAHACRESLAESWGVAAWRTP
jgi:hypothetical protein